jgi:hypothetical protein
MLRAPSITIDVEGRWFSLENVRSRTGAILGGSLREWLPAFPDIVLKNFAGVVSTDTGATS